MVGSNTSHIVNVYKGCDRTPIWVYITSRSQTIKSIRLNANGDVVIEFDMEETSQMIRIEGGKFYRCDRRNDVDYLTVYMRHPDLPGSEKSKTYGMVEMPKNKSFIVKPDGDLDQSYYRTMFQTGESDIWKDRYGTDFSKYRLN